MPRVLLRLAIICLWDTEPCHVRNSSFDSMWSRAIKRCLPGQIRSAEAADITLSNKEQRYVIANLCAFALISGQNHDLPAVIGLRQRHSGRALLRNGSLSLEGTTLQRTHSAATLRSGNGSVNTSKVRGGREKSSPAERDRGQDRVFANILLYKRR